MNNHLLLEKTYMYPLPKVTIAQCDKFSVNWWSQEVW